MRRHRVKMVLAGATAVWCAAPLAVSAAPVAGAVARAGTWRTAIEVPGLGSLNRGGDAQVHSVSGASGGNRRGRRVCKDEPRAPARGRGSRGDGPLHTRRRGAGRG